MCLDGAMRRARNPEGKRVLRQHLERARCVCPCRTELINLPTCRRELRQAHRRQLDLEGLGRAVLGSAVLGSLDLKGLASAEARGHHRFQIRDEPRGARARARESARERALGMSEEARPLRVVVGKDRPAHELCMRVLLGRRLERCWRVRLGRRLERC